MRSDKETTARVSVKGNVRVVAAAIGFAFPTIFVGAYFPVTVVFGDFLPGGLLYVVLLVGVMVMGVSVSILGVSVWRKMLLFGFLTVAYIAEVIALGVFTIYRSGLEGVF